MKVIYDIYSSYGLMVEGTPAEIATFNKMLSNAKRVSLDEHDNLVVASDAGVRMSARLMPDTAKVLVPDEQAAVG